MDRTSNQSILSTDYYTRFLVFHATQTGTIFKLNKIWRLNQKGSGRQMTPQFIFMVKVLLHTVLSVTFEMRIQGYSTNQDQSFVIRGKEKKNQQNSSAHLQMSQLGKQKQLLKQDCLYSKNPQEAIKVHTMNLYTEILFNFKRK